MWTRAVALGHVCYGYVVVLKLNLQRANLLQFCDVKHVFSIVDYKFDVYKVQI